MFMLIPFVRGEDGGIVYVVYCRLLSFMYTCCFYSLVDLRRSLARLPLVSLAGCPGLRLAND
jgi:hypothetical protein